MSQTLGRIKQIAAKLIKSGESTSSKKVQSWTVRDSRPCRNRMTNNYATGTFTGLIALSAALIAPLLHTSDTHATQSSLSVSVTAGANPSISIAPSAEGRFASTSAATFGVSTTHAAGYVITATSTALTDNTNTISSFLKPSDAAGVTAANYAKSDYTYDTDTETGKNLNNTWGFKPSKYYDATNKTTVDNTNASTGLFLPAPITAVTLDKTTTAANNNYDIAVGARVTDATAISAYSTTMTVAVTANVTPYTITYNANAGTDTVTNMPENVNDGEANGETVQIDGTTIPTRDNYEFKGWCSATTSDEKCSGTTYNKDGAGGNDLTYTIDQTATTNSINLYAMWASSGGGGSSTCTTAVPGVSSMQSFASLSSTQKTTVLSSMTDDAEYGLKDERDGKVYCVAKLKDGHVWMTQNLDLDLDSTKELKHENTDLGWGGTVDTSATWTPAKSTIDAKEGTISNWTNDNNVPYSVDVGDWYWKGKSFYASSECSSNACRYIDKSGAKYATYFTTESSDDTNGSHGHVGNYYNWSAAVAMNSTSSYSSSTISNIANNPQNSICPAGWRLPTIYGGSSTDDTKNEFYTLNKLYNSSSTSTSQNLEASPLFFVRGGSVFGGALTNAGYFGNYWSSTVYSSSYAYRFYFFSSSVSPASYNNRYSGASVRCVVR